MPKREPCRKCGNPVFFAERISFEQKLYHRSCLKCARCGAQLTLGSFYETETDGEYCCETCPDEEIRLSERRRSIAETGTPPVEITTNGNREGVRVSRSSKLLDRISFFESAPLSDEEKTSNLVRRAKISSFLKNTLDGDVLDNGHKTEQKQAIESVDPSAESEDETEPEDDPPPPPASEPPILAVRDNDPLLIEPNGNEDSKNTQITVHDSTASSATNQDKVEDVHDESEVAKPATVANGTNMEESQESPILIRRESAITPDIVESNASTPKDDVDEIPETECPKTEKRTSDNISERQSIELTGPITEIERDREQSDQPINHSEMVTDNTTSVPNAEENTEQQTTHDDGEEVPHSASEKAVITVPETDSSITVAVPELKEDNEMIDNEQYPSDLNPFGDESDEESSNVKNNKPNIPVRKISTNPFGSDEENEPVPTATKPPRPPPPKIKSAVPANPFDDEVEDEPENEIIPVIVKPSPRRTPVPTPRKQHNHNDSISSVETSLMSSQFGGSSVSLASSMESGPSSTTINRRKKSKAPDIPAATIKASTENLTLSQSTTPRKKRLAPAPPAMSSTPKPADSKSSSPKSTQRLITLDASLINNDSDLSESLIKVPSSDSVVYRRTIVPLKVDDDSLSLETIPLGSVTSERQWEKMKDNKEAQNRNRQSQTSPTSSSQNDSYNSFISNKSQQGKWKRRKGPAPALPLPLPERKTIKMLPLKEIRQELDIIETQQQGLEKQGVILEQMIRERCEGVGPEMDITGIQTNSKEVEDLIMQLFELVNEKNELFRRQAELMYLRRQHRLEQEQADLEYEIRLLMAQPERNKTDSDKEKEEALIARLVEIVQMRNEVVDCLEMDRLREAEEDMSIKQSIEERAANQQKHGKKDSDTEKSASGDSSMKLSKKEKKKLKEAKKLVKSKKIDSEKDADETENSTKEKKKKKKFFVDFLHPK